jgi:small-conductance mechanosensitive channel
MDNIEHDVKVLKKILNSPLFLEKYPIIERVWVDEYGDNRIDIVLRVVDEPPNKYWPIREEIRSFIWNVAKMAGVTSRFQIYP